MAAFWTTHSNPAPHSHGCLYTLVLLCTRCGTWVDSQAPYFNLKFVVLSCSQATYACYNISVTLAAVSIKLRS